MRSRRSFSLGKALSAAVASVPAAWGGAWLSLLLLWAALAAWPLAFGHLSCGLALAGGILVLWLLKLVTLGGLYRTQVFGRTAAAEGRGVGGLQFGAGEVRLLFASLLIVLFMALVAVAAMVVFAIAFGFSGLSHGYSSSFAGWHAALARHRSAVDWTFILLPVLMAAFFIFLGVKLALAPVATVAERRVVSLNAMGLSSGNAGKLFAGVVVLALPLVVLAAAGHHLPHPSAFGDAMHGPWLVHAGLAAVAVVVLLPMQTGFLTSAYRQIVDLRSK